MECNYIKIMPEIGCFPIWIGSDSYVEENVKIDDVCSDMKLISAFNDWDNMYQDAYDLSDPLSSGFSDKETLIEFEKIGVSLWRKLSDDLSNVNIEYFSIIFNKEYCDWQELLYDLDHKIQNVEDFFVKPES